VKERWSVGVVGATGAVGKELLSILEKRNFPVGELRLFASSRSLGKAIPFGGRSHDCRVLESGCFNGLDIVFFDASDAISKEWVPQAAEAGAWVIDNSATFRLDPQALLIVPEVNGHLLEARLKSASGLSPKDRVISGPNCSTVQLVVPLKAIRDRWGLKRVVVSSYQSTSGAGAAAMEELSAQTMAVFNQKTVSPKNFTHQIAFNCIPHIGGFKDDGYTSEEHKIMQESRKLLDLPELRITATAVRVPTLSCHGESIQVETQNPVAADEAREALKKQAGVIVQDEPKSNIYPMGFTSEGDLVESATGRDAVYVGRIRQDFSVEHGLSFWVVSDNLRKGAALNAIQIGELLVRSSR
jgi:aspartate-semialdehyde dehydrogenase